MTFQTRRSSITLAGTTDRNDVGETLSDLAHAADWVEYQLQPLVLPQPSQTWQEPAGRILVPQFMQSGESTAEPVMTSRSSAEVCASAGASLATSSTLTSAAIAVASAAATSASS